MFAHRKRGLCSHGWSGWLWQRSPPMQRNGFRFCQCLRQFETNLSWQNVTSGGLHFQGPRTSKATKDIKNGTSLNKGKQSFVFACYAMLCLVWLSGLVKLPRPGRHRYKTQLEKALPVVDSPTRCKMMQTSKRFLPSANHKCTRWVLTYFHHAPMLYHVVSQCTSY